MTKIEALKFENPGDVSIDDQKRINARIKEWEKLGWNVESITPMMGVHQRASVTKGLMIAFTKERNEAIPDRPGRSDP